MSTIAPLSPEQAAAALLFPMPDMVAVWNTSSSAPATLTYRFEDRMPTDRPWGQVDGFEALDESERAVVRDLLTRYEAVANVRLVEAADGVDADISFGSASMRGMGGNTQFYYDYRYDGAGQVTSRDLDALVLVHRAIPLDSAYGRDVMLHEIGHAFTLKHPGAYDAGGASAPGPFLADDQDNNLFTVMSYNANPHTHEGCDSLALYDIAALQQRWGANLGTGAGDDVYTTPEPATLWDAGGVDRLDFSAYATNQRLDLGAGHFSSVAGPDDFAIAFGVTIEQATTGAGNDRLVGNGADNRLDGGAGNDVLVGGAGADRFVFGADSADNWIVDFRPEEGDRLELAAGGPYSVVAGPDGAVLFFAGGNVTLAGVDANRVEDGWFATA
ncbi:M10 family metallopeptidase C-terminal domain-containing protein [Azospirillum sp. ST 5-10]|uniref:M10 family metallopeptidase C-terminal domain-containing protein n=1 Tax=unclassified Azospirillum TaxID=2630922 RepID=UPI003F4A1143